MGVIETVDIPRRRQKEEGNDGMLCEHCVAIYLKPFSFIEDKHPVPTDASVVANVVRLRSSESPVTRQADTLASERFPPRLTRCHETLGR